MAKNKWLSRENSGQMVRFAIIVFRQPNHRISGLISNLRLGLTSHVEKRSIDLNDMRMISECRKSIVFIEILRRFDSQHELASMEGEIVEAYRF